MLTADFLAPYRKQGDCFPNLLARSTYLSKYCREEETWTDTIRRVVEGNVAEDPNVSEQEAEALFDTFWHMEALPPGRGLWTGGIEGMPAEAYRSCWYTTLYGIEDWAWTANMLMLGGGVGVGLSALASFPAVERGQCFLGIICRRDHPNVLETAPAAPWGPPDAHRVEDSRAGWVEALRAVLGAAFGGRTIHVDVSGVRPRGTRIKTFGGTACGPGPLVELLRAVWRVVRGAEGRRLRSVEALDITNLIGVCIKSGNVRRSSLIILGDPDDVDFRDAKRGDPELHPHRHTSNNSLVFASDEMIERFDWGGLARDIATYGEPGIFNLSYVRKSDPGVRGTNACAEIPLYDKEACNLAEGFPGRFRARTDAHRVFKLLTRYCLRQCLRPFRDPQTETIRRQNMRLGVGLGGVCDFLWTPDVLRSWFRTVRDEADRYAAELGVARPIKVTTTKPSGTISLLSESSPGIHAPFAPYYLRRTRIASHEPIAAALVEAGVPFEPCPTDKTGRLLAFAFPMRAPAGVVTTQSQTVREQFERQVSVQEAWADNAVSSTISFDAHNPDELGAGLREFVHRLKSVSCLPRAHGYKLAPYEAISRDAYKQLYAQIRHDHPLVRGGDVEVDECAGGACPVK